jgi:hypothetical protein
MRTHRKSLVTPGLGALAHAAFPTSLFINALFPTFGYPTTAARTGRGSNPFAALFAFISSLISIAISFTLRVPFPARASVSTTLVSPSLFR